MTKTSTLSSKNQKRLDWCSMTTNVTLGSLGHIITADGILPDREHINVVLKAPPPSDAAALRFFLGLVSWYSKFLPNFATVVSPYACMFQWQRHLYMDFCSSNQLWGSQVTTYGQFSTCSVQPFSMLRDIHRCKWLWTWHRKMENIPVGTSIHSSHRPQGIDNTAQHKPGEKVRVRKPHHVPKAHPRFSHPATVRKKIGPNSFLLSDGKTWNASQLAHFPSVAGQDRDTSRLPHSHFDHHLSHKQPRVKYKPKWQKDYILCRNLRCLRIWTVEMILVTLVTL